MIVIVLNFLFYKLSLNNKVFKIVYKIKTKYKYNVFLYKINGKRGERGKELPGYLFTLKKRREAFTLINYLKLRIDVTFIYFYLKSKKENCS